MSSQAKITFEKWKRREAALVGGETWQLHEKIRCAAQLKAHYARSHADCTETDWVARRHASGPYQFSFDYQRADLKVDGPDPYRYRCGEGHLIYTGGGMAAIAAALIHMKAQRLKLRLPRGCYAETREVAELIDIGRGDDVVLVDSVTPKTPQISPAPICLFDTTCYAPDSRRLAGLVRQLSAASELIILARSHHKLDMLGTEYGRLGSLVVLGEAGKREILAQGLRDTIRLIGAAARPEDFAPFSGSDEFFNVTRARTARIIRNTRALYQAMREVGRNCIGFHHGLFLLIELPDGYDRDDAWELADRFAKTVGNPALRHAGSFGFDFTGTEWTDHPGHEAVALRVAPGDHEEGEFRALTAAMLSALKELLN